MTTAPHARLALWTAAWLACGVAAGCDLDTSSVGQPNVGVDDPVGDADASAPPPVGDAGTSGGGEPDARVTPPPADQPDAAMTMLPPGSCDVTGTFAVTIEAQVEWAGSTLFDIVPIITKGNGDLDVVVVAEISEQGGQRSAKIRACGATTPDFSSSINETYSVAFPDELWDKLALRWATPLTTSCLQPGCDIGTDKVVAQLGIGIPDDAKWPTSRDPIDVSSLRDDDGDGIPGVLLRCRGPRDPGGAKYSHPPTDLLLTNRASELMLAIRIDAQLSGKLDDCDHYSGDVPGMTIDTRALACEFDTGTRCTPDALGFVDDNLPVWTVKSAKFKATRLSAGASCADARAVMP